MAIDELLDIINNCSESSSKEKCKYQHKFRDGTKACGYIPTDIRHVSLCRYQGIMNYFNNYGKRELYHECHKK